MIDNSDVAHCWHRKKVLLTGVSTGRAGNLRGMEHLTGVWLYLKMHVHHNRLPISTVDKVLDRNNQIHDSLTLQSINLQLDEFLSE
jgi:NAD(P)H-dependent FMN reductase